MFKQESRDTLEKGLHAHTISIGDDAPAQQYKSILSSQRKTFDRLASVYRIKRPKHLGQSFDSVRAEEPASSATA